MSKIIPKLITRSAGRLVLKAKKNSPHLLFGAGVAGVVTGTVLACRATLKLDATLDEFGAEIAHHKQISTQPKMVQVYAKNSVKVAKLYAPAAIVGGIGIACLAGSHVQLTKRNGALTMAYAGIAKAYDEYRVRVRDFVGDEKELELYHGLEVEKVKIDGKTIELVKADVNKLSMYSRIFDEMNKEFRKDAELNRLFLTSQQHYFNQLLQIRGHVFLNEVYLNLGFEHSSAGSIVGWAIGKEGDNYVDFGLYNCDSSRFINGDERAIILDFNVDGVIYDKI
jgi:hypothetical protein